MADFAKSVTMEIRETVMVAVSIARERNAPVSGHLRSPSPLGRKHLRAAPPERYNGYNLEERRVTAGLVILYYNLTAESHNLQISNSTAFNLFVPDTILLLQSTQHKTALGTVCRVQSEAIVLRRVQLT